MPMYLQYFPLVCHCACKIACNHKTSANCYWISHS